MRARWAPQAAVKPLGRGCRVAAVVPRAALSPLLARSAGRPDPADFPEVVAAALGLWDTGQAGRLSSPVGAMCAARAVLATGRHADLDRASPQAPRSLLACGPLACTVVTMGRSRLSKVFSLLARVRLPARCPL